jgi:hypothetical protein
LKSASPCCAAFKSRCRAVRAHFRWPRVPAEPSFYPAPWETLDAIEGRDDPCRNLV